MDGITLEFPDILNLDLNPEEGFDELIIVAVEVYEDYKIYTCRTCHKNTFGTSSKLCCHCTSSNLYHIGFYSYDGTSRELRTYGHTIDLD